jgi:hypothetical protein
MERQLPTYNIHGTEFIVDIENNELRQKGKEDNFISFLDMADKGTHYSFYYDKDRKEMSIGNKADNAGIVLTDIPPMARLDPEAMSKKYGVPVDAVKNMKDFDIIVDKELFEKRMQGQLPIVKVAGHDFYVDLRMGQLRAHVPENEPFLGRALNLNQLHVSDDGEKFLGFYHIPSKSQFHVDSEIKKLPKDVVLLEIPNELYLDPIGVARQYGMDASAFVRKYPIQKTLEAKVIPLSETELPRIVKENQQKSKLNQPGPNRKKRRKGPKM